MFQCCNILSFKTEKRTRYLEVGYLPSHDLDSILSTIQENREIEKADRSYWPARFQQYTPVTKMLGQMTQELRESGYYGDYIWGGRQIFGSCLQHSVPLLQSFISQSVHRIFHASVASLRKHTHTHTHVCVCSTNSSWS